MENSKKKEKVFEIICPYCGGRLWVDSDLQEIIQSEKGAKKKASFDELLLREKKKAEGISEKFEATAELRQKKLEKAQAEFEKALRHLDEYDKDEEPKKGDE